MNDLDVKVSASTKNVWFGVVNELQYQEGLLVLSGEDDVLYVF